MLQTAIALAYKKRDLAEGQFLTTDFLVNLCFRCLILPQILLPDLAEFSLENAQSQCPTICKIKHPQTRQLDDWLSMMVVA